MVRRVRRGSTSSELLMCGGGVRRILLHPLVARYNRCMYMTHVGFYTPNNNIQHLYNAL